MFYKNNLFFFLHSREARSPTSTHETTDQPAEVKKHKPYTDELPKSS